MDTSVRNRRWRSLGIAAIDPDCSASCSGSGIDVAPAVAGPETAVQVESILLRGADHHARQRLPAITCVPIIMITREYVIQRQLGAQSTADLLNNFASLVSSSHIGLIGNDEKKEVVFLESN